MQADRSEEALTGCRRPSQESVVIVTGDSQAVKQMEAQIRKCCLQQSLQSQPQSNFKVWIPGFAASYPTALEHCISCFCLKTSNKSYFVLWGLAICLPSSELAALQLPWNNQPSQQGRRREGKVGSKQKGALMSTCFTFPTLHGNSKPNPMGIVFLKIWDRFGASSLSFFVFFFYCMCVSGLAISSVLRVKQQQRGREKMKLRSNAEKDLSLKFQRRRGPTVLFREGPGNVAVEKWQWGFSQDKCTESDKSLHEGCGPNMQARCNPWLLCNQHSD